MVFIGSSSRFNEFREEFQKDTGLKAEENMALYIGYVTARFADQNHRLLTNLSNEIREVYKVLRKV